MDIQIKQLLPNDWQKFKEIRLRALQSDPQAFSEKYENVVKRSDEEWQQKFMDNPDMFNLVAEDNGKVVGLTRGTPGKKAHEKNMYVIFSVYVDKEYRGQGIGKRLMEEAIKKIQEVPHMKSIKLWVFEGQKAAYHLYESLGFINRGEETDPEIACECGKTFIMEKIL